MSIILGHAVPDFTAATTGNKKITFSSLKGKNVVLYFYPKDNTPGCTKESIGFKEYYLKFKDCNTEIFGISKDDLDSHEEFRKNYTLPFHLISDTELFLCKLFDVIKLKQMYGKEYLGIERSTFLVDKDGILQNEWRKVRLKNHIDDVLQATQAINKNSP